MVYCYAIDFVLLILYSVVLIQSSFLVELELLVYEVMSSVE